MLLDTWFPEPLGFQKMKNYYTPFYCSFTIWGFIFFELLIITAETGNSFYWNGVQGATNTQISTQDCQGEHL